MMLRGLLAVVIGFGLLAVSASAGTGADSNGKAIYERANCVGCQNGRGGGGGG